MYVPTASGATYDTPAQIAAAIASQEAATGWVVEALVHTYDPEVTTAAAGQGHHPPNAPAKSTR